MNIELKPIAESKVRQLGGDVCGVLVRNEAGAWAAVSEGGRVMWLDDFEGQPSSAQGGQGAEVVAKVDHGCNREIRWLMSEDELEKLPQGMSLYTQPKPAVPEVPTEQMLDEGVTALTRGLKTFGGNYTQIVNNIWEDMAAALLSTPATPQADGWIKCSNQMPKLGQRVELFSQGVIQHMMPLLDEGDEGLFWDFEVHDYNPPVDVARDQWRPMPQPPAEQEGKGDE